MIPDKNRWRTEEHNRDDTDDRQLARETPVRCAGEVPGPWLGGQQQLVVFLLWYSFCGCIVLARIRSALPNFFAVIGPRPGAPSPATLPKWLL